MGQWLTPDGPVLDLKEYKVVLPDNDELRAAFFGAFLLLCEAENWQKFGDMSPEEAASWFEASWYFTHLPGIGLRPT